MQKGNWTEIVITTAVKIWHFRFLGHDCDTQKYVWRVPGDTASDSHN